MFKTIVRGLPLAALACMIFQSAVAGDKSKPAPGSPVFVELFTSQGCSSCPPADKLWGDLQKRSDVVALSFSIDYWDYMGWKDTLANGENSKRQQGYKPSVPSRQIFTPQAIVDGLRDVPGNEPADVMEEIETRASASRTKRVPVSIAANGDHVEISLPGGLKTAADTIWLAYTSASETVKIGDGENSGKVITYWNVVRKFHAIGRYDGQAMSVKQPARIKLAKGTSDGVAVWIQSGSHGEVTGAAQIRLR